MYEILPLLMKHVFIVCSPIEENLNITKLNALTFSVNSCHIWGKMSESYQQVNKKGKIA